MLFSTFCLDHQFGFNLKKFLLITKLIDDVHFKACWLDMYILTICRPETHTQVMANSKDQIEMQLHFVRFGTVKTIFRDKNAS